MKTAFRIVCGWCLLAWVALHAAPAKRPNILFIIADDQSPLDLRAYNPRSALETPTLDRLAARGMTIEGAYHMGAFMGAVCTPSRHMVMDGRTLWRQPASLMNRVYSDYAVKCPPGLEQFTLPAVFNRAGYATMRTCKLGNSYEGANQQFTVRKDASKLGNTDETGSPWHARQVLDYLGERERVDATARQPFLIYFGFSHPHDPRNAVPALAEKYGAVNQTDPAIKLAVNSKAPPLPENYLPAHPFPIGHPQLRDEVAAEGVWERRDEATIRNEIGRYFACSELIDTQIGRVLEKLAAMGELENTYVFYTADHGIAIGRHGLQGKQSLYEHSWRVPMIVQGPGIKPGSRAMGNIYLLDVLATLCDLAGVPAPETNEGTSFRSVLEGRKATIRDTLYGVYCGGTKPGMRSVRHGEWKLIKYDVLEGKVRETQLFNLQENPHELLAQNLAADPKFAAKRREMEALLLAEQRKYDDPYRLWDQPSDGLTPPKAAVNSPKGQAKKKQ